MPEQPPKPGRERHHGPPRRPRRRSERTNPLIQPAPEHDNAHLLLPDWLKGKLPSLYSQEQEADQLAQIKYFTPDANWTGYAFEGRPVDGDCLFFGFVQGFEAELGYFLLSELQVARGPFGLKIERDVYFAPTPYSKIRPKRHE